MQIREKNATLKNSREKGDAIRRIGAGRYSADGAENTLLNNGCGIGIMEITKSF